MKIYEVNNKQEFSFSCIYLWKNNINGKLYVGQSQNFYDRMKQYERGNDDHRLIGQALLKYGIENFDITILEKDLPLDKLDEREQYWMDFYQSYDRKFGYNICCYASTTRGYHHTEEDKQKMSQLRKQYFANHPEAINKGKDNPMYGKTMSLENRKKMSQRLVNNQYAKGARWQMTDEQKEKIRKAMLGKQNCLGRVLSQETKDKIAEANRHKTYSAETITKMSASHKGKTTKKVMCVETKIVYDSITEASNITRINYSNISHCCRGKQKTAGGYHWEYYKE